MSEADKTFGTCPRCKAKTLFTGIWASGNPTMTDGKKACVDCRVMEIKEDALRIIRERRQ